LTFTENFTEIVPGRETLRQRGVKVGLRGVTKYRLAIVHLWKAISRKRCKIGRKLVLITNRKSYMGFRLVSKSVDLNDIERRNYILRES